jgi:MGT family glycosyltransferase
MATVLVYTSPAAGHLYPVMHTALALRERGHAVRVRTLAAGVEAVRGTGLIVESVAPAIEDRRLDDWGARSPLASVKRALRTFLDRAAHEVADVRAALEADQPDILLVDTNAWGAQAVAEASGLPWATWHPFPFPLPSRNVPPFGPGLAPARGRSSRLRDALVRQVAWRPMQAVVPELNRVRELAGARAFARIEELFHAPPLVLLMTAEPLEYPRSDWPANVRLVGPGLWSPPAEPPAWLDDGSDRPVVLVTCSTEYQDDRALAEAAIEAFAGDPSVRLVCSTAGVDPSSVAAPPGVVVKRSVPHSLVLPHAAAVVCHGGMGVTQRALAAGVAPCVVPWGRDQLEVARRVVECGAGALVPRRRLGADALRAGVERARACAEGVARVRAGFAAAGGAERAADLVERLLP